MKYLSILIAAFLLAGCPEITSTKVTNSCDGTSGGSGRSHVVQDMSADFIQNNFDETSTIYWTEFLALPDVQAHSASEVAIALNGNGNLVYAAVDPGINWSLFHRTYACSPPPPRPAAGIRSIEIYIASAEAGEFSQGDDVTDLFSVALSRKDTDSDGLLLPDWNQVPAESLYAFGEFTAAILQFADPESVPQGSYMLTLLVTFDDDDVMTVETSQITIDS